MAEYTATLGNSYIKKEIIQNVSRDVSSFQKLHSLQLYAILFHWNENSVMFKKCDCHSQRCPPQMSPIHQPKCWIILTPGLSAHHMQIIGPNKHIRFIIIYFKFLQSKGKGKVKFLILHSVGWDLRSILLITSTLFFLYKGLYQMSLSL